MELTLIKGNSYTVNLNGTNICIYMLNENDAVLIDTGETEDRECLKFLKTNKIIPKAIINTHLHIDHIGNNAALCSKFGCKVYCSPIEVKDRCSGCENFASYLAENCEEGKQNIEGADFEFISTPGHSAGHQAVVTPDGVCCLGDAVLSLSKLKRSRIPYIYDAENAVKSMNKLLKMTDFPYYIAAHDGLISKEDIDSTIRANIEKEEKIRQIILDVVGKGVTMENLKDCVMKSAGVSNPATRGLFWMQDSVKTRIDELIKLEKLTVIHQKVYPK